MQMTGGINTVEYCLDACKFLSFRYAGLEFGAECCTYRLLDDLSSPDRTPLLKGAVWLSNMAERQ